MKRVKLLLVAVSIGLVASPSAAEGPWYGGCSVDFAHRPLGGWYYVPCWAGYFKR